MTKRPQAARTAHRTGVVTTLKELSELRAEARRLRLNADGKVKTLLSGSFRSPFKGRGMEFEEVRAYQPGDDPRTIDWRVSARTGRVFSKLFSEERERPVMFLVDAGPSMRFGTRGAFKSVIAARAAALLAWSGLEAGDRIGGIVRSPAGHVEIPPRGGKRRAFAFLDALARATAETGQAEGSAGAPPLARQLARLRRMAPTGSRVFVISDFYDFDESCRLQLAELARRTELTCVVVYDRLEESPPPPGTYRVSDGKQTYTFTAGGAAWRAAWVERMSQRRETVRRLALKSGVQVVTVRTDQEVGSILARALGQKTRERASRAKGRGKSVSAACNHNQGASL